ncbi:MAG: 2-oxoacid:acceptor oxidoreductase family protein [Dehalococcoidales bacterium]|nr:2-oxoacid:acceptor oxidoreductase family protein [Dehalococcoidales bacterium]
MARRHEIRLCGRGGQGVILAGHIMARAAAIFEHKNATLIQDYGPEARGGACRTDIVISDDRVLYPYLSNPSVLMAMSQQAFNQYCPVNRDDTVVIVEESILRPGMARGKKLLAVPARKIAEELGRGAVANMVMLGFLTAVTGIVSVKAMKDSILASVPKNTEELNTQAFDRGYAYGLEKISTTPAKGKAT